MILVGLDGSRTSWRAASYANGLARRQRSHVTVVYVASPGALAGDCGAIARALPLKLSRINPHAPSSSMQLQASAAETRNTDASSPVPDAPVLTGPTVRVPTLL